MIEGKFWDLVDQDADYDEVEQALLDLVRPLGVTNVGSMEMRAPVNATPFIGRLFGKRDTEYTTRYRKEDLSKHDVAAIQAAASEDAFSWSDVRNRAVTRDQNNVFAIAAEHGFTDGWVVPYFGAKGGFGLTSYMGDQIDDSPSSKRLLTFAGLTFYRYAQKKAQPAPELASDIALTKRQKEILYWIAKGKTDWEMSQVLNIAERTVNRHVEMMKNRLGVRSRAEALAMAMTHNLIERF